MRWRAVAGFNLVYRATEHVSCCMDTRMGAARRMGSGRFLLVFVNSGLKLAGIRIGG